MSDFSLLALALCVPVAILIIQKRRIDAITKQLHTDLDSLHLCQSDSLDRVVQSVRVVQGTVSRVAANLERVTTARQPVADL